VEREEREFFTLSIENRWNLAWKRKEVKNVFKTHQLFLSWRVPLGIVILIGGLLIFSAQPSYFLANVLLLQISKHLVHLFDVSSEIQLLSFGEF